MLYDAIKQICAEKGISIRFVESKAHLSNGTISKWNDCKPSANSLLRVATILGCTVEDLLRDSG